MRMGRTMKLASVFFRVACTLTNKKRFGPKRVSSFGGPDKNGGFLAASLETTKKERGTLNKDRPFFSITNTVWHRYSHDWWLVVVTLAHMILTVAHITYSICIYIYILPVWTNNLNRFILNLSNMRAFQDW